MKIFWGLILCISILSCKTPKIEPGIDLIDQYIFIGHSYDWMSQGEKVDPRIEAIDFTNYKGVWLGGDICAKTTQKQSTVDYIDNLFDLHNPHTHFAIGNHDIGGDIDRIPQKTGRHLFYSNIEDDMTILVLNTNTTYAPFASDCDERQRQLDEMSDAITNCSTPILVVLMHHAIFPRVEPEMGEDIENNCNAPGWQSLTCDPSTRFKATLYPLIKEYKTEQTSVYIIAGDGGQYSKKYFFKSQDDIEFYISGINNSYPHDNIDLFNKFNNNPDSILIFKHDKAAHKLKGEFKRLF